MTIDLRVVKKWVRREKREVRRRIVERSRSVVEVRLAQLTQVSKRGRKMVSLSL